jgi:class 3 adenylate cyclase
VKRTSSDGAKGSSLVLKHRIPPGKPQLFKPFRLGQGITVVGRRPASDIVLDADLVSRQHAKILVTDMGITVHDLDSHNGIFINGKKVRSAPLKKGDLLYVGSVCISIEEGSALADEVHDYGADLNSSDALRAAHTGSENLEDPIARNLAAICKATDLLMDADDQQFYAEVVQICRELTGAEIAAWLTGEPNDLSTGVLLQDAMTPTQDIQLFWPVAKKVVSEGVALFASGAEGGEGAIMCVPIFEGLKAVGAIYLARPDLGPSFTERELNTLSAISHIVGSRMAGRGGMALQATQSVATAPARTSLDGSDEKSQKLQAQVEEANTQILALQAELDHSKDASAEADAGLKTLVEEMVPLAWRTRLEALLANPNAVSAMEEAGTCALIVGITGVDAWAGNASPDEVKERLDRFCAAVKSRSRARGGTVTQVMGHTHLILFPNDSNGVLQAVACAGEIMNLVPPRTDGGVHGAMHAGTTRSGFCGDGPRATHVQVGEAILVAQRMIEKAQPNTLYCTDAIKKAVASAGGLRFVAAGPHLITGMNTPVELHFLTSADAAAAAAVGAGQ